MTPFILIVILAGVFPVGLHASNGTLLKRIDSDMHTSGCRADMESPIHLCQQPIDFGHGKQSNTNALEKLRVIIETDAGGDPDDEQSLVRFLLSYQWAVYREAGSYTNEIKVINGDSSEASVCIPTDAAGKDIHVILTTRDEGQPPLARYRRAIIKVDPANSTATKTEPSWRSLPLINGGNVDSAWRHVGWGGFAVDDGVLQTVCDPKGLGLLVYEKEQFGNCQIRVVFKSENEKCNAGVFVRIDQGILAQTNQPGAAFDRDEKGKISKESMKQMMASGDREEGPWYAVHRGYEVQIMDVNDPFHRTGAIYSLAASSAISQKAPGEWKTMVITLEGNEIFVDLEGKRITRFDPAGTNVSNKRQWFEPKREPKRPIVGYLGLQNHDPGDVVWFKEISVRPLSEWQNNLIYNGDLELNSDRKPPEGWAMWGAQQWKIPDHFVRDTSQSHEGKASLRIFNPGQSQSYIVTAPEHAIRPKKGMTYNVSFWAKADAPTLTSFGLTAYETIQPFRDAPTPGFWPIQMTTEWKHFTFRVQEGLEFFAPRSQYLMLTFRITSSSSDARTLWVDDVSVTEQPNSSDVRLIDPDSLVVPALQHRLRPGERFEMTLDVQRITRPVTHDLAGVSFHRVAGWTGLPYDRQGRYVLAPELEKAIRELHLPMTRFYAVGDESFPVEESIDKVAEFCRRIGVPLDHVVLELEDQSANRKLDPKDWARAVRHSVKKGYAFRHWEIGNEVYSQTFGSKSPMGKAFATPDDYIAHVKSVSAAVKAEQPGAQIGLSINMGNLRWGGYVLKQAAPAYDFVCPHLYAVWQAQGRKFETVTLTENNKVLEQAERIKALIRDYNEGRDVYVYDTEWGMHSSGPQGERADDVYRNGNLWGAMHRAVRMIYYVREGMLRGASSWEMFSRLQSPGFGFVSKEKPNQYFLLYWLYYYFNRHLGESVLEIDGTAPYYSLGKGEDRFFNAGELLGPLTPTLATLSADKKSIYLIIANASWDIDIPCQIDLRHFNVKSSTAIALSQRDPEGHPLVDRKEDFIKELQLTNTDQRVTLTLPARTIMFAQLRGEGYQ